MKIARHTEAGTATEQDDRTLDQAKQQRLAYLRQRCTQSIEEAGIDAFDQTNAALGGILDAERETFVRESVKSARDVYLLRKVEVVNATDNASVDNVDWEES